MFSAADLIDALRLRRTLKSIRPETPGLLPPGWQGWLEAMPARAGAVTGAPAESVVATMLQRALNEPASAPSELNRWQAFTHLWRQQWHPASRDERSVRVAGLATSLLLHLLLGVALVWLMDARFLLVPPPAGEPQVVQVEFIGRGTPDQRAGGEPAAQTLPDPSPETAQSPTASPTRSEEVPAVHPPDLPPVPVQAAAVQVEPFVPEVPQRDVPTPRPQVPPRAQPLQVTVVPRPDIDFVLPPTTPRIVTPPQPELAIPERALPFPDVPEPELEASAEVPRLATPTPVRPATPEIAPSIPSVPRRDVPAPVEAPRLPVRELPRPVIAAPEVPAPEPEVRRAEIPTPSPAAPAVEPSPRPVTSDAAAATPPVPRDAQGSGQPDAASPARPAASSAQAGTPAPAAGDSPATSPGQPPGAWPTPARGDDWGDALRNRPGGQAGSQPGLFDDSGRPRLADGPPGAGPGAPPGSVEERIADLERAGTWLQRPPYDYTPTRFDKFWIPGGTLLEDWVRRGIREVSIPIPGTSKKLSCVVSILQLGGGCGLVDPNLQNRPATARPPPDIPFKPELQEDQDTLARPPGG